MSDIIETKATYHVMQREVKHHIPRLIYEGGHYLRARSLVLDVDISYQDRSIVNSAGLATTWMFYYVNISDVSGSSRQLREDSETELYLSLLCTLRC